LQAALNEGQDDLVQQLLEAGTRPSTQGARHDSGVDVGQDSDSTEGLNLPLHLPKDFDSTAKDANGLTPLQRAVQSGHEMEVRLLVEHYQKHNIAIPTADVALYSQIFCDECGSRVPNWEAHYHCHICLDDDFDICFACVEKGIPCRDEAHRLVRRRFVNGKFVLIEDGEDGN
jgi:hypothetical protein